MDSNSDGANSSSRSKALPNELKQAIDRDLTQFLYGPQDDLGDCSSDQRRAVWLPALCQHQGSHRFIYTVDHVNRAYYNHGNTFLACRCCADMSVWVAQHRRPPSAYERFAYGLIQHVFGDEYWCFYEVHLHRRSIDVMLMHKTKFFRIAVHVDGRQHKHSVCADVAFDAQLHAQYIYPIRLRADAQCTWLSTLQAAHDVICKFETCLPQSPSLWCQDRTPAGRHHQVDL